MRKILTFFLLLVVVPGFCLHSVSAGEAVASETRFVEVDGDKIAYRRIGSGPPILLATRLRGTLDTWDPLFLDSLAKQHTVITFDYPGVGYSSGVLPGDMDEVAAFVDRFATAIDLDTFAVLGWSWGGLVMQTYLLEHPERVTQAILVGTNPPGRIEIPAQQVFIDRAFKPVNNLEDEEVLFFEPASESSRAAARASHDRIHARPGVTSRIPSTPEAIQAYLKAVPGFVEDVQDRRGRLARIHTPILIIAGDHDTSTAGQNWLPLIGQMQNAQFLFYSGTGHGPQHQHPELSADYIADFLARTRR